MRLGCPNCNAQYEIDDAAIPTDGREVQCSACGHGWFQYPPVVAKTQTFDAPAPLALRKMPEPAAQPKAPVLNDIRAFLREEAEHETVKRRAEGVAPPPPVPPRPQEPPRPRLPDLERIDTRAAAPAPEMREDIPEPDRRGFRRGFFWGFAAMMLLGVVYFAAPGIARAAPAFEGPLAGYTDTVDQARLWLAGTLAALNR